MNYKICVIGNEALLFPFLQFGFQTFHPPTQEAIRETLQAVIDDGYGIIYMEDSYCYPVKDILDKYKYCQTPIFIPLGESDESESYHQRTVREMMEKAIGMQIT